MMMRVLLLVLLCSSFVFAEEKKKEDPGEIVEAAEKGDLREVKELLKEGISPDVLEEREGITALVAATIGGHVDVVKALLEAKADVNKPDKINKATPLMWAALLKPDKEAMEKGLVQPPPEKKLQIAKMLLQAGAKANLQNEWGGTALQWAADEGNLEQVQMLLEAGADPNLADQQGLSALAAAAHYEGAAYQGILKSLLKAGAKVDARNHGGETALMATSNNFGIENAQLLVKAGADVNAADQEGISVLMKACKMGRAELTRFLIDSGARLDAKTAAGLSVLQVARQAGYKPIIDILQKAGAPE